MYISRTILYIYKVIKKLLIKLEQCLKEIMKVKVGIYYIFFILSDNKNVTYFQLQFVL